MHMVKSICHVTGYNLNKLYNSLIAQGIECRHDRSCLWFRISRPVENTILYSHTKSADGNPPTAHSWKREHENGFEREEEEEEKNPHLRLQCFVFASGVLIVWGLYPQVREEIQIHELGWPNQKLHVPLTANSLWNADAVSETSWFLTQFAHGHLRPDWNSDDTLHYAYDHDPECQQQPQVRDVILLKTTDWEEMYAASMALSQSSLIGVYESILLSTIRNIGHGAIDSLVAGTLRYVKTNQWKDRLHKDDHLTGDPFFSRVFKRGRRRNSSNRNEVIVQMASLYSYMIQINMLQSTTNSSFSQVGAETVSIPEYFWEHPKHQGIWSTVLRYMEVQSRLKSLDSKCGIISQFLKDVTLSRNRRLETKLTWMVIFVIFVDILAILCGSLFFHRH